MMDTRANLDPTVAEAIARGDHGDPFAVLGMHERGAELVVRTFQPSATSVSVVDAKSGREVATLARKHKDGLFEGAVAKGRPRFPYRLNIVKERDSTETEDPYRFPPVLGELDVHLLAEGNHLRAFDILGAHPIEMSGVHGVAFAVWAPNAKRVSVVGTFNDWDGRRHVMRLRRECGVWEIFIPGLAPGDLYKYEIKSRSGEILPLKSDPYARQQERPPSTASIVAPRSTYRWQDHAYRRSNAQSLASPISIYEVHLGSWKRKPEENGRYMTYEELADDIVPYARDMGFTHIELLPIAEYPFDGSWGYQPLSLFAPTSRFGTPDGLRALVDRCHQEGLGVITDWVAGHFPTDPSGLGHFDGTHIYGHADPRLGRHQDWGTLTYNYGRNEVANYLLSNALYWIEAFHMDGLRVDAVASMLYLDYSRKPGEWIPNAHGGRENLEAIHFLKRLNELVYRPNDGAITVAEESTAWPMVSRPTWLGGLGFGYKWNMGWMHDTLQYFALDPIFRHYHHNNLTFGLTYAFAENFVLALSHDEVVHGKGSLLRKMHGDRWQKFANLRAYYAFMYTHPGKKLLFMGGEFAQEREWNHDQGLDWHLLGDAMHRGVQQLVRDLNQLYRAHAPLHELDCRSDGFEWIDCTDVQKNVICYLRRDSKRRHLVTVCNFSPMPRHNYRVGVPDGGEYIELINTDAVEYGGSGVGNAGRVLAEPIEAHGRPHSLVLTLPPLATLVLGPAGDL